MNLNFISGFYILCQELAAYIPHRGTNIQWKHIFVIVGEAKQRFAGMQQKQGNSREASFVRFLLHVVIRTKSNNTSLKRNVYQL